MALNRRKTAFITFPLSLIYGLIVTIRNRLFDLKIIKSAEFDIPVISIGNITVGGTGKTPHIEYLIRLLANEFNIAVLSRGYKRKTRNYMLAAEESTSDDIGDEPKQLKQKFPDVHIAVDRKRVHGILNRDYLFYLLTITSLYLRIICSLSEICVKKDVRPEEQIL